MQKQRFLQSAFCSLSPKGRALQKRLASCLAKYLNDFVENCSIDPECVEVLCGHAKHRVLVATWRPSRTQHQRVVAHLSCSGQIRGLNRPLRFRLCVVEPLTYKQMMDGVTLCMVSNECLPTVLNTSLLKNSTDADEEACSSLI